MASILVIEDDVNFQNMLCDMLSRLGHEAISAPNGEKGLELLENRQLDIVITDILMPKKDGIKTIKEISKNFPGMKIIAISGGGLIAGEEYLKAAKLLTKIKVTLAKPFSKEQLISAIELVLK